MRAWLRKSWPVLKTVLALAILAAIGRQFARDLARPELWQRTLHLGWLGLSAVLYLLGLGFSAFYWYRLLVLLGQRPALLPTVRAHYIGQMGKYLPCKAWALFLRSNLVRSSTTRVGVAILTSFYEVFITMLSGALFAAVWFGVQAEEFASLADGHVVRGIWNVFHGDAADGSTVPPQDLCLLALILVAGLGIPSLPPVFRRLVQRLTLPFRQADTADLPTPQTNCAVQGLILTPGCWLMLGASLWATLHAVGAGPAWSWENWMRVTAFVALAYVSGFIILFLPSGLGAREALLLVVLTPDLRQRLGLGPDEARSLAALTVIVLRLVWTAAEVAMVAVLYWLPATAPVGSENGSGR